MEKDVILPICNGMCGNCEHRVCTKYGDRNNINNIISDRFENRMLDCKSSAVECKLESGPAMSRYRFAVDIGTTTIVVALVDTANSQIVAVESRMNSQRQYGVDVVSRIYGATNGKASELRECVLKDIKSCINEIEIKVKKSLADDGNDNDICSRADIVIACNTTMSHILMGYDCTGLSTYPFVPVNIELIEEYFEAFDRKIIILPGISAYVGADIVSGMYAYDFDKLEKVSMLIDLGTNGEIVIGDKKGFLATSTAAGPAFENSDITWASGAIDEIAKLLDMGLVDETGLMTDEYFETGYCTMINGRKTCITQRDIRNFQTAKAAIRAGINILVDNYGTNFAVIDRVYLAGGMGYMLDVDNAIKVGLLPKEFKNKTISVGNSALAGAVKYTSDNCAKNRVNSIKNVTREVVLSMDSNFYNSYIEQMSF